MEDDKIDSDDIITDDNNTVEDDQIESDEDHTVTPDEDVDVAPVLAYTHNFTTNGTTSDFFSIKGNLSSSKGTVNYNGLTLTTCLKVESATSIKFTTTEKSNLTLVFNSNFNKSVTIDGTEYKAINGILNVALDAGAHTITKGDTGNLFYISLN